MNDNKANITQLKLQKEHVISEAVREEMFEELRKNNINVTKRLEQNKELV